MASKVSTSAAANRAAAEAIVRTLRDAGHIAYFAGGCVRDELLGLAPTDYDVATNAVPERLAALFPRTSHVGASFGVVLVMMGHEVVEVATFRADGTYSDNRRPDRVTFSDPLADAQRRDFTVNALFLDPLDEAGTPGSPVRGRVIDHVGGLADLAERRLRAVGDADRRLAEDHLRALRAVRLAARLGFTIEAATGEAIGRHASELRGVSRERIGDEVRRMMAHASRAAAAMLLRDLGLEAPVLETKVSLAARTPATLASLPGETPVPTALAAWALDLGHDPASTPDAVNALATKWRQALCLSNDERAEFQGALLSLRALTMDWESAALARQKRLAAADGFPAALILLDAVDPTRAAQIRGRVRVLDGIAGGIRPVPLISGDDLQALGLRPGPGFRPILEQVYDAQLEGRVTSAEEARELARRLGV